jgi:BirA family biotin operon repressor/biotin-[acetyl-CoA-carboxylase] ligase
MDHTATHDIGQRWGAAALQASLQPTLPGLQVQVLREIDSTNTELMRRARAGAASPTLLVAEVQTAGRGRLGRQWQSASAQGHAALAFSLGLPLAPHDWSGLSLAVGLSLAEALHADLRIKWPNDLWWDGRKLSGILIETAASGTLPDAPRQVVIGIGINLEAPEAEGLSTAPAWVREFLPALDAPGLLQRVALPLIQTVLAFEREGFAPLQARYAARDVLAGREVVLSDGLRGKALGVSSAGALRVRTEAGVREINSAEVSVRPAPAAKGAA